MIQRGADRRRIRWLQWLALLPFLLLAARLVLIQVVWHERFEARASDQWRHRETLPAQRGNLYDRRGRSLALSVRTYRVGVACSQVKDPEQTAHALAGQLEDVDVAALARRIRAAGDQHIVIERQAVLHRDALHALALMRGVTCEERNSRVYPLGGTGASLIGFQREDPGGGRLATGLENAFDGQLAGTAGEGILFATAIPGRNAGGQTLVKPVDGHDVVLTIDADLQVIAEDALALAGERRGAGGGLVLIVEPTTGEILAAADTPVLASRADAESASVWDNFAFTGAYEPGSVFKIFTAAALLRHEYIDTTTVYDCDDGQFEGYRIRNSEGHDFGMMSFGGAFAHSSNVYFARAVLSLSEREFHRELVELGFGSPSPIPYPGRPTLQLKPVDRWSGRSQSTMAIGQEILVTPLQLAMGACAVANGGMLMTPRIWREVRTKDGSAVERSAPAPVRRILDGKLAELLRLAMARTVREGTGQGAAVSWTEVGGKTGTAEKALPGRGYVPGLYMSSFLGLVPVDAPRLVVLTLIDEPDYTHHYAAQCAAPLFAAVVEEIGRTTGWLSGSDRREGHAVARRADGTARSAPDLLYRSTASARAALAEVGLVLAGAPAPGLVVAQTPSAGTYCLPGEAVHVTVAPSAPRSGEEPCPDLTGLSGRSVRREAARLGVAVLCVGEGYVRSQTPAPGERIPPEGIEVRMVERW